MPLMPPEGGDRGELAQRPGPGALPVSDAALKAALQQLRDALRQGAADLEAVIGGLEELQEARSRGATWAAVLQERRELLGVIRLHERISQVVEAASTLRRLEVEMLLAEGIPHGRIARLVGVTRQRISQISKSNGTQP